MNDQRIEKTYELMMNPVQKQWLKQHLQRIYNHYMCTMRALKKHPRTHS